jgi:carbonic anhydrase
VQYPKLWPAQGLEICVKELRTELLHTDLQTKNYAVQKSISKGCQRLDLVSFERKPMGSNYPSRREWLQIAGVAAAGATIGNSASLWAAPPVGATNPRAGLTADDALADLMAGNERFIKGQPESPRRLPKDYVPLATAQFPEAVILACADSRVPPEILFDQGVGDLFVVRVAGNVVGGTGAVVKGSIEYAVAVLNVPLIMVLGHSNCGAVKSAIEHIDQNDSLPGAIEGLVNLIKPAVTEVRGKPGDKLANAIRANVRLGVERLKTLDPILASPVSAGKLKIVGATYDLATGRVEMVV